MVNNNLQFANTKLALPEFGTAERKQIFELLEKNSIFSLHEHKSFKDHQLLNYLIIDENQKFLAFHSGKYYNSSENKPIFHEDLIAGFILGIPEKHVDDYVPKISKKVFVDGNLVIYSGLVLIITNSVTKGTVLVTYTKRAKHKSGDVIDLPNLKLLKLIKREIILKN